MQSTPVSALLKDKGNQIYTIQPQDTVYACAVKMKELGVGALMVLDNEQLVGIVSERDFLRKIICSSQDPHQIKIEKIMTPSPLTISLETSVQEAMKIVTEKRFRHLPVIDDGKLVGLISIGDLTRWVMMLQESEIEALTGYIHGTNHY